ncbi:MAG: CDP-archaeol synthase [Patescibacteria group bacterium]
MDVLLETGHFLIQYWFINTCLNTFKFIPGLAKYDRPLDGGRVFSDGRRWLGSSTTALGFPVSLLSGSAIGLLVTEWYWGLIMAAAVYAGHALGSFIKRRAGWSDGRYMLLVDHGDSVFVAGLALMAAGELSWLIFVVAFVVNLLVQPLLCRLGYVIKLRSNPL